MPTAGIGTAIEIKPWGPGMRWLVLSTLLVIVLHSSFFILNLNAQGTITTIAGGGTVPLPVGGPSINAPLGPLAGVAIDSAGNIVASDPDHNRVVEISAAGVLTLVAGNGIPGFWGDGGPAVAASLNRPTGLAVDAMENLYIAVSASHRIQKLSPDGTIGTVAGTNSQFFLGDGGLATKASLDHPSGVTLDAEGNIYIADWNHDRVRKVWVAGSSAAPLFTANGVANGASFITGVSPGAIATIFGTGLSSATGIVLASTIPLPTQLRETKVSFDGFAAPLFAVDNVNGQEQINLQVPYEMAGKATASVVVINNGGPSVPVQMNILAAQPGVFTVDGTAGAILHVGTYQLVTMANPAARGEAVAIFATGFATLAHQQSTGSVRGRDFGGGPVQRPCAGFCRIEPGQHSNSAQHTFRQSRSCDPCRRSSQQGSETGGSL